MKNIHIKNKNGVYRWENAGGYRMTFDGKELWKYDTRGNRVFPNRDDMLEFEQLKKERF